MFNDLYEWAWLQKPLLWDKSGIKKIPTEKTMCAYAGHNQDYTHISVSYRDTYTHTPLVLQFLSIFTANKIAMQHQFGMTYLCYH